MSADPGPQQPAEEDLPMDLSMKKEDVEWREMEEFVSSLKRHRSNLGLTQGDVGTALGRIFGNDFSQTTVSRFEAMNLSYRNMCKLKPMLQVWLDEALGRRPSVSSTSSCSSGAPSPLNSISKRRKKRTSFDLGVKSVLENAFKTDPKPSVERITALAVQLNMDREVVRVWFCNRRQKEKRVNGVGNNMLLAPPGIFAQHHWTHPGSSGHQGSSGSQMWFWKDAKDKIRRSSRLWWDSEQM